MLDAFIIDELRRREQAEQEDSRRPRLELPLDRNDSERPPPSKDEDDVEEEDEEESDRGVVIIDLAPAFD